MKKRETCNQRIVVVVQEYLASYREPFWSNLISTASNYDIRVSVACGLPSGDQALRGDYVDAPYVDRIRQQEWSFLGKRIVIRRSGAATKGADLVIIEQARRNLDAYKALLPGSRNRPIRAMWGHGRDFVGAESQFSSWLLWMLTRRMDWFFAYTEEGRDALVGRGFPSDRITVVQNSIDTQGIVESIASVSPAMISEFQRQHDLTSKVAVFVGGLDKSKRITFLLEAAIIAHEQDSDFRLVIAGDGEDRSIVEDYARQYRWIRYLGPVAGRMKALALESAGIIAMPGRVGLIAVDSFACGRPILTTDWEWHAPEYAYLEDGVTCVVAGDSVQEYGIALAQVFQATDHLRTLQFNCLGMSEKYTIDAMSKNYFEGIRLALEQGKRL